MSIWKKPIYRLTSKRGKDILIDVTSSVSPGLPPNKAVSELVAFFRNKDVQKIVDFGAGSLRHTFPLLDAGFQVCAVEFEENFVRPICKKALAEATANPNFSKLIYPKDFIRDHRKFDAALLCYVLQVMPLNNERKKVLKYLYRKLREDAYLVYMSRYNQMEGALPEHRVEDGYYKWPDREHHSFYREFTTEDTHEAMKRFDFKRVKSLSQRGNDQIFLYAKGTATWI
jgi:SAM-dependent methyltransferase